MPREPPRGETVPWEGRVKRVSGEEEGAAEAGRRAGKAGTEETTIYGSEQTSNRN